jgi:hypothetical protein
MKQVALPLLTLTFFAVILGVWMRGIPHSNASVHASSLSATAYGERFLQQDQERRDPLYRLTLWVMHRVLDVRPQQESKHARRMARRHIHGLDRSHRIPHTDRRHAYQRPRFCARRKRDRDRWRWH